MDYDPVSLLAGVCIGVFTTILYIILGLKSDPELDPEDFQ